MSSTAQKWLLRAAPWFLPVGIVLVWQLAGCRAVFCPLRRALWKRSGR